MAIDLHREPPLTAGADSSLIWLERYLIALETHARRQTDALERLVEIAEAGRAGEEFLEAALKADAGVAGPIDLSTLDFVRTPDRKFLIRENGELRQPTPAEAAVLATTVNGGQRDRRESRR